ncbi:hypothetical protein VZC37_15625 [Gordonia sp. LSe1-13]|uniref:PASTA domain-containing protein n=1 Tax=Gordonia sesuvii TaxID=3116777 RepID=A0ABU7MF88_9ACTN|nr:hypothetical protein [Gordonia sp. LSe1-13]
MSRPRRGSSCIAVLLCAALGASVVGCETQSAPAREPGSSVDSGAFIDELASAGIEVFRLNSVEPIVPAENPGPLRLTEAQAMSAAQGVAAGAGMTGAAIDDMITVEPLELGATPIPASLLVSAWVDSQRSPASRLARTYMGEQDLRQHTTAVFPSAVLGLYSSDVAGNPDVPLPPTAPQPPHQGATGTSLCETFKSAIYGSIERVFNAIGRFETVGYNGDFWHDVAAFVRNIGATVGNFALDTVKAIIVNGVRIVTGPVVSALATVAGMLAVATTVVTTLQPWTGAMSSSPDPVRRDANANRGSVNLRVRSGLTASDWPDEVAGCARAAGVELPSLQPRDAGISWKIDGQYPEDMVVRVVDSGPTSRDGSAILVFDTIPEPPDRARGEQRDDGRVHFTVDVHRRDIDKLERLLSDTVFNEIPGIVIDLIGPQLHSLIDPQIRSLLGPLAKLRDLTVKHQMKVVYHTTRRPSRSASSSATRPVRRAPTDCPPAEALNIGAAQAHQNAQQLSANLQLMHHSRTDARGPGAFQCAYGLPTPPEAQAFGLPPLLESVFLYFIPTARHKPAECDPRQAGPTPHCAVETQVRGARSAWYDHATPGVDATGATAIVDGWTVTQAGVPTTDPQPSDVGAFVPMLESVIHWATAR